MVIEIGSTVEGTVVKLADYGAIVRLAEGRLGLVHISEVADAYVRDLREYFKEEDRVPVKVLKLNSKGRYELSLKQADASAVSRSEPQSPPTGVQEATYHPYHVERQPIEREPVTFEDRLSKFMKDSQERQLDLKRNIDSKRGGRRKF